MKWIQTIFREVLGLFVDDASFALAILLWLGAMYWVASRHILAPVIAAILLFAGLALILIESALRFSRRKRHAAR